VGFLHTYLQFHSKWNTRDIGHYSRTTHRTHELNITFTVQPLVRSEWLGTTTKLRSRKLSPKTPGRKGILCHISGLVLQSKSMRQQQTARNWLWKV